MCWLFLSCGLVVSCIYFIAAIAFMMTIVGAPCGYQLFKLGCLSLSPFGLAIRDYTLTSTPSGSCCSPRSSCPCVLTFVANCLWLPLGILLVFVHVVGATAAACSIVGIPFVYVHLKLASFALCPFGKETYVGGGGGGGGEGRVVTVEEVVQRGYMTV